MKTNFSASSIFLLHWEENGCILCVLYILHVTTTHEELLKRGRKVRGQIIHIPSFSLSDNNNFSPRKKLMIMLMMR